MRVAFKFRGTVRIVIPLYVGVVGAESKRFAWMFNNLTLYYIIKHLKWILGVGNTVIRTMCHFC